MVQRTILVRVHISEHRRYLRQGQTEKLVIAWAAGHQAMFEDMSVLFRSEKFGYHVLPKSHWK